MPVQPRIITESDRALLFYEPAHEETP